MRLDIFRLMVLAMGVSVGSPAYGQSSSLYHQQTRGSSAEYAAEGRAQRMRDVEEDSRNPLLDETSLIAVAPAEPLTFQIHDLVTIIVVENKRFETDAKTRAEKRWRLRSELDEWARFDDGKLIAAKFPNGQPNIDYEFESRIDNRGKLNRQDRMSARIAAEVIDVKPNGNLVLEATRRLVHDEEEITATLIGVCRSSDISADNTILSSKIARFEFSARHCGAVRDGTRRGWLTRLLDLVRPI